MYYSIMSELEYFNTILHTIIDPMHNLFLGTAKKDFQKDLDSKRFAKREGTKRNSNKGRLCSHSLNYWTYTAQNSISIW